MSLDNELLVSPMKDLPYRVLRCIKISRLAAREFEMRFRYVTVIDTREKSFGTPAGLSYARKPARHFIALSKVHVSICILRNS